MVLSTPVPATDYVHARVDPAVKREAETVLTAAGLTTGQAIRALMTRIAADGRLPFDIFAVTDAEIEQARRALDKRHRDYDSRRKRPNFRSD